MRAPLAVLLLFAATSVSAAILDDLDDNAKWTAAPSDGVSLNLVPDHGAMRMDFDFRGHGGWAAAPRAGGGARPGNFRLPFRPCGGTPTDPPLAHFIDPSGRDGTWGE